MAVFNNYLRSIPITAHTGTTSRRDVTLTSNDGVAMIFRARAAETLTKVWAYIQAVTSGDREYEIGLMEVSGEAPSGTFLASTTFLASEVSAGFQSFALDASQAVTANKPYAVVIQPTGTGSTGDITVGVSFLFVKGNGTPNYQQRTSGSWGTSLPSDEQPIWGVGTASRDYGFPFVDLSQISESTSGNRVAARLRLSGGFDSFKVGGFRIHSRVAATEDADPDVDVALWPASGAALRTVSGFQDVQRTNGQYLPRSFFFDDSPALNVDTTYYLGFEANPDGMQLDVWELDNAAHIALVEEECHCLRVATYDGATWTEDDTKFLGMEVAIRDITSAGGGPVTEEVIVVQETVIR